MKLSNATTCLMKWAFALLLMFVFQIGSFAQARQSKPIVAIRFNAHYSQLPNSEGDEWAPTWADEDNLYTGNDDGSNFGGIRGSSVAFGKLVGDDPFHLA